jgi:hypothetical protein
MIFLSTSNGNWYLQASKGRQRLISYMHTPIRPVAMSIKQVIPPFSTILPTSEGKENSNARLQAATGLYPLLVPGSAT